MDEKSREGKEKNLMYLLDGIENASFPGVIAYAGVILPIPPVTAQVVVTQEALIPFGTDPPVDSEVLGQE